MQSQPDSSYLRPRDVVAFFVYRYTTALFLCSCSVDNDHGHLVFWAEPEGVSP